MKLGTYFVLKILSIRLDTKLILRESKTVSVPLKMVWRYIRSIRLQILSMLIAEEKKRFERYKCDNIKFRNFDHLVNMK